MKMADAINFVLFTYNFLHYIQEITHGTQFKFSNVTNLSVFGQSGSEWRSGDLRFHGRASFRSKGKKRNYTGQNRQTAILYLS